MGERRLAQCRPGMVVPGDGCRRGRIGCRGRIGKCPSKRGGERPAALVSTLTTATTPCSPANSLSSLAFFHHLHAHASAPDLRTPPTSYSTPAMPPTTTRRINYTLLPSDPASRPVAGSSSDEPEMAYETEPKTTIELKTAVINRALEDPGMGKYQWCMYASPPAPSPRIHSHFLAHTQILPLRVWLCARSYVGACVQSGHAAHTAGARDCGYVTLRL